MGLDVVELVMRCEEAFDMTLDVDQAGSISTVGDLFELICSQLDVEPGSDKLQPANRPLGLHAIATADENKWSRDAVWSRLVRICAQQLQIAPDEITYNSRFKEDLGAD